MSRQEIFDKVKKVICDILADDSIEIEETTYMVDQLELDSFEIVEIVTELETEFKVTFDEDKMTQFVQIKDVIDYIEDLCK